jgi:hypothetical protein
LRRASIGLEGQASEAHAVGADPGVMLGIWRYGVSRHMPVTVTGALQEQVGVGCGCSSH